MDLIIIIFTCICALLISYIIKLFNTLNKEKAISTLKNKFTHYLYKPNGIRAKQKSDTTLVGKKHREEKVISTLTNKVYLDIIYFINQNEKKKIKKKFI